MNVSEIDERIHGLLDGELEADEKRALQEELMSDPVLMERYLAYARLDNILHLKNEAPHVNSFPVKHIMSMQKRSAFRVALMGVAAVLMLTVVFMKFFMINTTKPLLVFRVSDHSEFIMSYSAGEKQPEGDALAVGSKMELTSGVVELTFENGVQSIITAPAEFTLEAENRLHLNHGIAWFSVSKEGKGFTVVTSDLEVIDLGTEFGVISSVDKMDEVHVFKGLVEVNHLKQLNVSEELRAEHGVSTTEGGELVETVVNRQRFLSSLPEKKAPKLVFLEQFDDGLAEWVVDGAVHHEVGDFGAQWGDGGGVSFIDTVEDSDHSGVVFDVHGNEVRATGQGYVSIGSQRDPGNKITTSIQVFKGLSYHVYFRFGGSHSVGVHNITGTFSIGDDSATSGALEAPVESWESGSFTFTPKASGMAQLTFDDAKTIQHRSSDLLLDSVVVTAVPVVLEGE